MKIIQCPDKSQLDLDPVVFLAGGISNCPDWQEEMIDLFRKVNSPNEIVLINPRRINFNMMDVDMSGEQIEWEYHYLDRADAVSFWFPKETLCPITLFELGKAAAQGKKIYVGCHPDYPRVFDVKKQLQLLRPEVIIHCNVPSLVAEIVHDLDTNNLLDYKRL